MSTISIISERILRILNGGNVPRDSQFHQLDVQYLVRDTAAQLVKGEWFNERNEGGTDLDPRYVVPFHNQKVLIDDDTEENYVDIPVNTYIRLPNGGGIRSVRPDSSGTKTRRSKNQEYRAFIPIPERFEDIYFELPTCSLEGVYGWMVRKDRIYFTKKEGKTLLEFDISKVTIDIVSVDVKAVDVDDHLPLSSDMVTGLIANVIEILRGGAPKVVDVLNDENPNVKIK